MGTPTVVELGIADVAKDTGLSLRALRLYEEKGLLSPARLPRKNGGYPGSVTRIYSPEDVDRIHGIILASKMGFSLREIAKMIEDGEIDGRTVKPSAAGIIEAIAVHARTIERAQAAIKLLENISYG